MPLPAKSSAAAEHGAPSEEKSHCRDPQLRSFALAKTITHGVHRHEEKGDVLGLNPECALPATIGVYVYGFLV